MFRRRAFIVAPLGAVVALFALAAFAPTALATKSAASTGSAASAASISLDVGIFEQVNAVRAQHGLEVLTLSSKLSAAAELHSQQMVEKGYFGHDSPDGSPFWQRVATYYPQAGYHFWAAGENLLWTNGQPSARMGIDTWMASPRHRANILDPNWREIGIGAVSSPDAPGTYGGHAVTVITADFGVRRSPVTSG